MSAQGESGFGFGAEAPTPSVKHQPQAERGSWVWRLVTVVLAVVLAVTLLLTDARAARKDWQWRYRVWMPPHWIRLAQCESGHTPPDWKHHDYYEGAFGFDPGSWDDYRPAHYPAAAYLATPWQQWVVARRIAAKYGMAEPWGCWRGPEHAWVRGGLPEHGTYR